MSKGSTIAVLGLLAAFLPFTGIPMDVKIGLEVVIGLTVTALGFLVRQERLWLLRALSGEQEISSAENGEASQSSATHNV